MKQMSQSQASIRTAALAHQKYPKDLLSVAILLAATLACLGQSPGTQRWRLSTPLHIFSSPAISQDGTIYVGAGADLDPSYSGGGLYSLAPEGTTNWYLPFPKYVRSSPALGPDGRIYVGCMNGELKIVDPTGKYQVVKLGGTIPSSPAIGLDGTVYVGSFSNYWNKLHALTPDGATKWVTSLGNINLSVDIPEQFSSPAIGPDGTIYVGSLDKNLYAITAEGTTNWIFPLTTATNPTASVTYSSPSIAADGTIYIGADNGHLYAIEPSGVRKWDFVANGIIESSAAIADDGTIYVGSLDGNLYAINPDGTRKWAAQTGLLSASPAIAADGTVYVGSLANQKMFAFDAFGSNLWTFTAAAGTSSLLFSSVAIGADGTIYFGSGTGVFALYGTAGPMSTWSMFRGNLNHTARAVQRQIQKMQLLADNTCQIDLGIESGRAYKVEWSSNLVDWNTLTNLVSNACTNQVFDTQARDWTQRYYRLSTHSP